MNFLKLTKKESLFFFLLIVLAWAIDWKWFCGRVSDQIMQNYYVNYSVGWIPGGFMGSVMGVLYHIFTVGTFEEALYFLLKVGLFFYIASGIILLYVVYIKGRERSNYMIYGILAMAVVIFPMFQLEPNFGILDMFAMILFFVAAICLALNRGKWLILLCVIVGICVDPGFSYRLLPLVFLLIPKE